MRPGFADTKLLLTTDETAGYERNDEDNHCKIKAGVFSIALFPSFHFSKA
jgi:hypothetical protein